MRRLSNIKYYKDKFANGSHNFLFKTLSAISFLMMFYYFGYIVYFSTICYDTLRVIVGCIALVTTIHLNKSLY